MSERFFTSPNLINISDTTPLIFLEGPVQGALDWQTPLAERLLAARSDIAVASPRRTKEQDQEFVTDKKRATDKQVAWEYIARSYAMDLGGIALWWAPRDFSVDYPEARVYGKTTALELGEIWGWKRAHPDFAFAMGYDPAYEAGPKNSKDYISRNHAIMGLPIVTSVDALANAILESVPVADPQAEPRSRSQSTPPLASQSIQRALDLLRSE